MALMNVAFDRAGGEERGATNGGATDRYNPLTGKNIVNHDAFALAVPNIDLPAGEALTSKLDVDNRDAGVVNHGGVRKHNAFDLPGKEDLRCGAQPWFELVDTSLDLDERVDGP